MRSDRGTWNDPFGIAVVAIFLFAGTVGAIGQDVSRYPDWSGQWGRGPGMGNGWDPAKPQGLGQEAPLTAEYRAIFESPLRTRPWAALGAIRPGYVFRTACPA